MVGYAGRSAPVALALLVIWGSAALADRRSVDDPSGDASPAFTDIVKAKAAHGRCGKLRHVLGVADGDQATASLAQLEIKTGDAIHLINARDGGARIKQRGDNVIFTFKPGLIGNPRHYGWAATIGSNDTSPEEFDRVPDKGYVNHKLYRGKRFRGYRSTFDGNKDSDHRAVQGEFHGFTFRDRLGSRTRYKLVLRGPRGSKESERGRTNCRGKDTKNLSLYVNDVGGPGKWVAKWKVGGRNVARYQFKLKPEFES